MNRADLLSKTIDHLDIKQHNLVPLVESMEKMAFQARNTHRAAQIVDSMLADTPCGVVLTLAGSLISAGLKQVVIDMVDNNMVDMIVSTGANIVDQDFFEALGFKHYIGDKDMDDNVLRELEIDRIYDTFIDERDLRICDEIIANIANGLNHRAYSSREFINVMADYLVQEGKGIPSIIASCRQKGVPIFIPAFSDCSAGFGLVMHQTKNPQSGAQVSIDSAKDFLELTRCKTMCQDTGLLMLGGGVPKNFAQDIVVAADLLGEEAAMHKYAVQLTVADERDGALSGSTLREACSWGKVSTTSEQMVWGEATLTLPLIASYAFHKGSWKNRQEMRLNDRLENWTSQETQA